MPWRLNGTSASLINNSSALACIRRGPELAEQEAFFPVGADDVLLTGFSELLSDLSEHRIELRPYIVVSGAGHMAVSALILWSDGRGRHLGLKMMKVVVAPTVCVWITLCVLHGHVRAVKWTGKEATA
jgi:hypothetical protein